MRTIIWKEIRENLMWGILALAGFGGALAYALAGDLNGYRGSREGLTICGTNFLQVTTFGAPLLGLALGILQIALESARDRWAFLIHRPVSRSKIFCGKVAGGMGLYFLATLLPFALISAWAAWPGRVAAPFTPEMTFPGVADILSGIPFYFAGMLAVLRPARWYSSRGLGIPAAIAGAAIIHITPEFWMALAAIAFFSVLLGAAAWGSFLTAGVYAAQPRVARIALAVVNTIGVIVLASIGAGFAAAFQTRQASFTMTSYMIDKDGEVLKVTQSNHRWVSVTGLDNKPIERFKSPEDWETYQDFLAPVSAYIGSGPWLTLHANYRSSDRYFINANPNSFAPNWFYSVKQKRIIGFAADTRLAAYTAGPKGFARIDEDNPPFTGELRRGWFQMNPSGMLVFSTAVYQIDFPKKTVAVKYSAGGDEIVSSAMSGYYSYSHSYSGIDPGVFTLVGTSKSLVVLRGRDGSRLFSTALRKDVGPNDMVLVSVMPDESKIFVQYQWQLRYQPSLKAKSIEYIDVFSKDGQLLKRHELPNDPVSAPAAEAPAFMTEIALMPPLAAVLAEIGSRVLFSPINAYVDSPSLLSHWKELAVNLLCAALCAAITIVVGRRNALGGGAILVWSLFVMLMGFAGLLVFASIHDWQARVPCAACSKKRVVNRETCEHCGAEFQPPPRDGTEIIEAA